MSAPPGRPTGISGAGAARLDAFDAVVERFSSEPSALSSDPARARVSVMLARSGGVHATRVLPAYIAAAGGPELDRLVAVGGLETWGGAGCLDTLERELAAALASGRPADPLRAELDSLRGAAAVRAIGAVLRRSPQAPRTRAVESMLRAVTEGDPRIRSAALRALGFLAEPAAGPGLEREIGLQRAATVPAADLVFALCRCGSPRASETLEALAGSR